MMYAKLLTLAALAALAASPVAAQSFTADLLGANEVPAVNTSATGFARVLLTGNGQFAQFDISFTGLSSNLLTGHVHCCALPGFNAGVAINFAPPTGLTTGSFTRSYDLSLLETYAAGFRTANNDDAAMAQASFLSGLNNGRAYVNLHNAAFPGGEIRGNLNAVPEPASWAMMISGFGLVGATLRRRRVAVAVA